MKKKCTCARQPRFYSNDDAWEDCATPRGQQLESGRKATDYWVVRCKSVLVTEPYVTGGGAPVAIQMASLRKHPTYPNHPVNPISITDSIIGMFETLDVLTKRLSTPCSRTESYSRN
jgi:hypothetical protein